jgi:hypothetical protein
VASKVQSSQFKKKERIFCTGATDSTGDAEKVEAEKKEKGKRKEERGKRKEERGKRKEERGKRKKARGAWWER